MFAHNGYWLHPAHCQLFSVHVTFSVLARERKNSHATAKKFSRRFSGKHAPQSERFWFVFPRLSVVDFRQWCSSNSSILQARPTDKHDIPTHCPRIRLMRS
ncbi:DUF1661 domain-containing protein [Porphyromonas gingivalis]|uniref:DUF1661 domain-containing protein n=1 Tax=Porphyromonas gingivalis TaxID=837 RepID=UPI0021184518|nr:DUF1661 domain-containing protein [Porphyromonas gingivalis]